MKRPVRFLKTLIVLAIVFATALYVERVRLSDLWREATAPELPAAVSYADIQEQKEEPAAAPVEEIPVVAPEPESAPDPTPEPAPEEVPAVPAASPTDVAPTEPSAATLPASINLAVPFTSQAPSGNWDEVHEETCEEASSYMAAAFYQGMSGTIAADVAEAELQRLVAYELDTFGFYKDTNAEETVRMISDAYGYRSELLTNPTVDDIKSALAAGHPVIVPAAGQELGNPYFTAPGPPYHMFVIRGYSGDRFIVNDPGTRHGEAYTYSIDTVMSAIHDWNGGDVEHGARVVIVVLPG